MAEIRSWTPVPPNPELEERARKLQLEMIDRYRKAGWIITASEEAHLVNMRMPEPKDLVWRADGPARQWIKIPGPGMPKRSWWRRLWRWALRKPAIDFFVVGSQKDPAVQFMEWLRRYGARVDLPRVVDGSPMGIYFKAVIDGEPFELSLPWGGTFDELRIAVKTQLKKKVRR